MLCSAMFKKFWTIFSMGAPEWRRVDSQHMAIDVVLVLEQFWGESNWLHLANKSQA